MEQADSGEKRLPRIRRWMLCFVVLLAFGVSSYALVQSQDSLAVAVKQAGGDYQRYNLDLGPSNGVPLWWRVRQIPTYVANKLQGIDRQSVSITFGDQSEVDDVWLLKHATELQKAPLNVLTLRGNQVSDTGIAALQGHPELFMIDLTNCNLTDETVPVLASLPKLTQVNVRGTEVTSEGISKLLASRRLWGLEIDGDDLDSALVQSLNQSSLHHFGLHSPTSESITQAGGLTGISSLTLTNISNRHVASIIGLKSIGALKLLTLIEDRLSGIAEDEIEAAFPKEFLMRYSFARAQELGIYERIEAKKRLMRRAVFLAIGVFFCFVYIVFRVMGRRRRIQRIDSVTSTLPNENMSTR